LDFSSVCIPATNIPERGLGWPSAGASWIDITGASGSNRNPEKDRPSDSPSPLQDKTGESRRILIVEDNPADVFLMRQAIKAANIDATLQVAKDALILLDINLPRKQGGEVLQHMRKSRKCGNALVIAVSTSDAARDRDEMVRLGAKGYFRKPSNYVDFMKLGDMIKQLLGEAAGE
jgi:CheY-like chemotaxis protein